MDLLSFSARFWAFFERCPASQNSANTMDAIKKKMQAMKLEKDNAMDRADACEQQAKDANLRAERVKIPNPMIITWRDLPSLIT